MLSTFPKAIIPQRNTFALLCRLRRLNGDLVRRDQVESLTYTVTTIREATAVPGHTGVSIDIDAVVYNQLQGVGGSDTRWTIDATGWNFLHIPQKIDDYPPFPLPGRYMLEYEFVWKNSIDPLILPVLVDATKVYRAEV